MAVRTALVIGGTLFIGRRIVRTLHEAGWRVSLVHRGESPSPFGKEVREVLGDRKDRKLLRELLGTGVDTVVDTCGYDFSDIAPLLPLLQDRVGRYVFLSTVSVYDTMRRFPTEEDHPYFEGDPSRTAAAAYATGKIACEQGIRTSPARYAILRPAYVYGPWNTLYREAYYFDRIRQGKSIRIGRTALYLTQLLHASDLADAVLASLANSESLRSIYNVAGPAMTQRDSLQALLEGVMPGRLIEEGEPDHAPWGIRRHLCVSTGRLTAETGWRPKVDLAEGMSQTYAWYREHAEERRSMWDRHAFRSNQTR